MKKPEKGLLLTLPISRIALLIVVAAVVSNLYGSHPDKAVCFHCSNLPKHFFENVHMDYQAIIAGTVARKIRLVHVLDV